MAEETKEPGAGQEEAQVEPEQPLAQRAQAEAGPWPPPRRGGLPSHIVWAIASAIVLVVFAPGLFAAGFFTNELVGDDGGSAAIVAQPTATQPTAGQPQATPPPAAVAASADDDPYWGPVDAPVTVIEFSDFQCPFCSRFWEQTLPQIKQTYEGKVKFVYRDFPLARMHEYAQKAAEASECADDQGKYWEYHDLLFQNFTNLTQQLGAQGLDGVLSTFKGYASQLGLDTAAFNDCLDSGKYASEVEKDYNDGVAAGVTGTPSFFINGVNVSGAQPLASFKTIIDAALQKAEGG
ncbi:MAG: DsbA family protein [Chloroflexota bacterium]|nr:DsbA family protein [Chloroflexota bacterium]